MGWEMSMALGWHLVKGSEEKALNIWVSVCSVLAAALQQLTYQPEEALVMA